MEVVLRSSRLALADGFDLGVVASYTFATVESAEATQSDVDTYISENDLDTKLPFDNVESFRHVPVNVKGGNSVIEKGFDRRHRGVLRLTATLPHEVSLGLNTSIESGFLYPPAIVDDERDRALATGPTNHSLDFRAAKGFSLGSYTVDLLLDVTNLTNARNVIAYDPGVENLDAIRFQQQGIPALTLILRDGSPVYGPARQVFFGARVRF